MPKMDSAATTLIVALVLAAGVGYGANRWADARKRALQAGAPVAVEAQPAASASAWVASAPGRVEPRGGEARISAQAAGRVAEVVGRANDRVAAGDLLIRLDDDDARERLVAAESEVAVRRRERDAEGVGKPAQDRRAAEDALAAGERNRHAARVDLDRLLLARRKGAATSDEVERARSTLARAVERIGQERDALRRVAETPGMPLPTRLEAALAAARADLSLAELAFDRTRIRAPMDGTLLQVNVRVGESLAAAPDVVAMTMGDLSALSIRAEVEERDVAKIRVGQRVVVRCDAFTGRDFEGKVVSRAGYVGPPRLGSRGPRKPTDVDVLEVVIDLDPGSPLLPGMRTDVFFRPDLTASRPAGSTMN